MQEFPLGLLTCHCTFAWLCCFIFWGGHLLNMYQKHWMFIGVLWFCQADLRWIEMNLDELRWTGQLQQCIIQKHNIWEDINIKMHTKFVLRNSSKTFNLTTKSKPSLMISNTLHLNLGWLLVFKCKVIFYG
jgi:hypothetical protein